MALRQFAARIAVGPDLAAAMQRMAPDSGAWMTVPNLVDTDFFTPTQPPAHPVRIVTVSNLTANMLIGSCAPLTKRLASEMPSCASSGPAKKGAAWKGRPRSLEPRPGFTSLANCPVRGQG